MNFKLCLVGLVSLLAWTVSAQTTAFTYQGQLGSSGSLVTGSYDFRFRLFDNSTNLIAGPVTNAPVGVTNGLFITTMDFGATAFNGAARALEIGVRSYGNTNAYTVLAPNQAINSTPYAIQSLNASNLTGLLSVSNLTGTLPVSLLPTNVALLTTNVTFLGSVTATNFYGSGSGLTGVPATSLTGILPDANLSANVPRLSVSNVFLSSITAVQFNGGGHGLTNVPGAFFWLTVNGTSAAASSNLGFIVTNNTTPVTITLPASPSVGDTFKVAGVGAGGWIMAQNAGQQILAGNLAASTGLNWTQQVNSGSHPWTGLASSADGTKLFATTFGGDIYYSVNSGVTWTATAGTANWSAIACSADGTHLVATVGTTGGSTGYIYTSANSGVTWNTSFSSPQPWVACASSADGTHLAAASYNGYLYTSANGGTSWSGLYSNTVAWTGVTISADGTKLAACSTASGGGYICTSVNSGANFSEAVNSGLHVWSAIASSADGTHLVATASGNTGGIYNSANGGASWAPVNQNSVNWTAVASSSDGSHLAAVYDTPTYTTPGYVYTSPDSGSTWLQRLGATNAVWTSVASSADGGKLAAAAYNGYIYTSGQTTTTAGTTGYLIGEYQSAIELQYVGNGIFLPLNHEGTIRAY